MSVTMILQRSAEEISRAEAAMHEASSTSLLFPSERLSEICRKDSEVLSLSSISYDLIANVLEGIVLAAKQSRGKAPIVGGKFKVERKVVQAAAPLIYPFIRTPRNSEKIEITNIEREDRKCIAVSEGVIGLVRLGFLAKGSFALDPQTMIDCLELTTAEYTICVRELLLYLRNFDLTQPAMHAAKIYGKGWFCIDDFTTACYLPYKNYQMYLGHGLTVKEFSDKKEALHYETAIQMKTNYATARGINPRSISRDAFLQIRLQKDAEEGEEFVHIFNNDNRDESLESIPGYAVEGCQILDEAIYVFESTFQSYAEISPQSSSKRKQDAPLETQESGNRQRIRWGSIERIPL